MFKTKSLLLLVLFIASMYLFVCYDDWMNDTFVDTSISSKSRVYRALLYGVAQTKYGYWIVRGLPLGLALFFLKGFIRSMRTKNEE